MTADDAFTFFNGQRKLQQRLNALRQAGIGYLRLGQPVSTLSGGESQRLRIAALLAGVPLETDLPTGQRPSKSASPNAAGGTLFILDEPSTGLHHRDIQNLMKCLNHLVEIGHSVIVIEHDSAVIDAADYIIRMGPGPGKAGGRLMDR
jgi:excinuclease ABC subunit A